MYTHEFDEPLKYNDKEYKELTFDFGKLKGKDNIAVKAELRALGKPPVLLDVTDDEYLMRIAVRACTESIGADIFDEMSILDSRAIVSKVRGFLNRSGSAT